MAFAYCIIPSGKSDEFGLIDANLIEKRINAEYFTTPTGGRVYRIPEAEVSALHMDGNEPHLGYQKAGGAYRLFRIIADRRQSIREDLDSEAWMPVEAAVD